MNERIYTTAEICELLEISKSTLFRWEQEDWFPPIRRDLAGQRLYTDEHIRAIGKKQLEQLSRQYGYAAKRKDKRSLEELMKALSLRKFLVGDIIGLYEMAEYPQLPTQTIRLLLRTAVELEPNDPVFAAITQVVAEQSRKLSASFL